MARRAPSRPSREPRAERCGSVLTGPAAPQGGAGSGAPRVRPRIAVGAGLLAAAVWLGAFALPAPARAEPGALAPGPLALASRAGGPVDWTTFREADAPEGGLPGEPAADAALTGVTWTTTFEAREAGPQDGRTLIGWRAGATSSFWSGTFAGDVDVLAVEAPDAMGLAEPPRWLRLALTERWGPVTLGIRLESVSPGLERVTGGRVKGETEGGEAWIEGRQGPVRLRLAGGQFWDNLTRYPWESRTTKTQGGASLDLALPLNTHLRLGYHGGLAERDLGRRLPGRDQAAPTSAFHSVATAVSCAGSAWSVTVSSTYTPQSDLRHEERESVALAHDLSASIRLLPTLTLTPALSLAEEVFEWTGTRSQTASASLSVSWASFLEGVDLSVSGSYARSRTTDDLHDATAISAVAGAVWRLRQAGSVRPSLALEAGSHHYLDGIRGSAGHAEVFGMVTLRLTAF